MAVPARRFEFIVEAQKLDADCTRCDILTISKDCISSTVILGTDVLVVGELPQGTESKSDCDEFRQNARLVYIPQGITDGWVAHGSSLVWECAHVSVPDSVRELCDHCFSRCSSLRRITFGPASRLERIGVEAFSWKFQSRCNFWRVRGCPLEEIFIPDSVREIGDRCFSGCHSLRQVTLSSSSRLERIGVEAFSWTKVRFPSQAKSGIIRPRPRRLLVLGCLLKEIFVPDSVREIGDRCFSGCRSLRRVVFGPSSRLERIGVEAFSWDPQLRYLGMEDRGTSLGCPLRKIFIPESVRELGDRCFSGCSSLRRVTFGFGACLERIGSGVFSWGEPMGWHFNGARGRCPLEAIFIPASVREIGDNCFSGCEFLYRVIFGSHSSLVRIGRYAFSYTYWDTQDTQRASPCPLLEIDIPDSVRELCSGCFGGCDNLRRITFGSSSLLERIERCVFSVPIEFGDGLFAGCSAIEEIFVPDCVRKLCGNCFSGCSSLRCVRFGSSSRLERIGIAAFSMREDKWVRGRRVFQWYGCPLEEIFIPGSVRVLRDRCFCGCSRLRRVTFGFPCCLADIGAKCFKSTGLTHFECPPGVRFIGTAAFANCLCAEGGLSFPDGVGLCVSRGLLLQNGFRVLSFIDGIKEVAIPDEVQELCDSCFSGCSFLRRISIGPHSRLERMGIRAFSWTKPRWIHGPEPVGCPIEEIFIPNVVREIGDHCFAACYSLRRVTFGSAPHLERIGVEAFSCLAGYSRKVRGCPLEEFCLPDSVREIGSCCFAGCFSLDPAKFGSYAHVECIGADAFPWDADMKMKSVPSDQGDLSDPYFSDSDDEDDEEEEEEEEETE